MPIDYCVHMIASKVYYFLMLTRERIDIAIIARDEEGLIADTIKSAHGQDTSNKYHFAITVEANACNDNTVDRAEETIAALPPREGLSFAVEESDEAGKNATINRALGKSATRFFMYADADVLFSADCFRLVAQALEAPDTWVGGPVSKQLIPHHLLGTTLGKLHLVRQLYNQFAGYVPAPMGRMIGFRRDLVGEIPLHALADERYITLSAIRDHGTGSVKTVRGASVYAKAAGTMQEFLDIGDRIATVRQKFVRDFPELGTILQQVTRESQASAPSREAVEELLVPHLIHEGIDPAILQLWYDIKSGAVPKAELLDPDWGWKRSATTKL